MVLLGLFLNDQNYIQLHSTTIQNFSYIQLHNLLVASRCGI